MSFREQHKQLHNRPLRAMHTERTSFSASVTLEGALVLPLFLFMMMNLLTLFSVIRVQSVLTAALTEAGRRTAVYAFDAGFASSVLDEAAGSNTNSTLQQVSGALCITYAADQAREYMRKHAPDLSCVRGGLDGIDFYRSGFTENTGIIDLVAHYEVNPMFGLMSFMSISMEARYYGHAWTGYQGGVKTAEKGEEEEVIVYITPQGTVYHLSPSCTYLKPSVSEVSKGEVSNLRNKSGGIYYPCEACTGKGGTGCYITSYGDRYHSDSNCRKIYHDIIAVRLSDVGGRGCCSKCSK